MSDKTNKNWFARHWILSIILVILIVGMFGVIFDSGENPEITGKVINKPDKTNEQQIEESNQQEEVNEEPIIVVQQEEINEEKEEDINEESWSEDLREALEDLKETTSTYKKVNECTELCAGENIDIPVVKGECHSSCYQIYYYTGEEGLDEYIEELKG